MPLSGLVSLYEMLVSVPLGLSARGHRFGGQAVQTTQRGGCEILPIVEGRALMSACCRDLSAAQRKDPGVFAKP